MPLDHFSSTCLYFGEGLADAMPTVPIGLIHTAWGGSMIEQWLTNQEIAECKGAGIANADDSCLSAAPPPSHFDKCFTSAD